MRSPMKTCSVMLVLLALALAGCQSGQQAPTPTALPPGEQPIVVKTAEASPITVTSERRITDIINEKNAGYAAVSPDGSRLAWARQSGNGKDKVREVCVFKFDNADKKCSQISGYTSYPYQLAWSPDSEYIAFTEDPVVLGDESDIWLYKVADGTIANSTDDGVSGSFRVAMDEGRPFTLDYLPMWNKTDGNLYFWRSLPSGMFTVTLQLFKMPATGGEPVFVRDLTETFSQQLLLFDYTLFYLNGVSAISPDGTKVAMVVRSAMDALNAPNNGLWVVDLTSPDAAPKQVADMDAFQLGMPPWAYVPAVPLGLAWAGDSKGVVVFCNSNDMQIPLNLVYYADVDKAQVTPITNFSLEANREAFQMQPNEVGVPPRYYSPWSAAILVGGKTLVMYNNWAGVAAVSTSAMPAEGAWPTLIYKGVDSAATYASPWSSSSIDGKVVMADTMFTFSVK